MNKRLSYNEHILLQRIAQSDQAAFQQLFHQYQAKIYSIAFDITESIPMAEDIVQDVFLKIWLKRKELTQVTHFTAYLFTITRNYTFTALKSIAARHKNEQKATDQDPSAHAYSMEEELNNKELNTIIQQAVNRLPEQQKQVYRLIREQGYTREEAARQLQLSPETVKSHLAQATRNIRAYYLARIELSILLLYYLS